MRESMVVIYKNKDYYIYDAGTNYIVHNHKHSFSDFHIHIKSFSTAKYLINLAIHKSIPNRKSKYFIDCLIRISDDYEYISRLKNCLKNINNNNKRR